MRVRVKKVKAAKDPEFPTPEFEDYIPGQVNKGVSTPCEYEVCGKLAAPVEVDSFILLKRDERNGVACDGVFRSSRIKDVKIYGDTTIVETYNSVYSIEKI